MVSTLLNHFFFVIFGKSFSNQILVEQGKVKFLLEKPCHFQNFFSQKSGISSGILIFFFAILNSCSTNVHTQNWVSRHKIKLLQVYQNMTQKDLFAGHNRYLLLSILKKIFKTRICYSCNDQQDIFILIFCFSTCTELEWSAFLDFSTKIQKRKYTEKLFQLILILTFLA
jgi:hypothetical protein